MAFTEQNKSDAYLFFVLAFGAAPGKTYGAQIVDAYNAGMDTAAIVAEYVTKPDFLKLYPATQTPTEFATALVNNVASAKTTAAVKEKAVADIVKAMAGGMKVDGVITQIMGNLAKKDVADTEWGATVAQINNKIAVAKVLTEGAKALETTDAAALQSVLKGVTEDQATVEQAISGAGTLAAKLAALQTAMKAGADYVKALDNPAATDLPTAKAAIEAGAKTASEFVVAYSVATSVIDVITASGGVELDKNAAVKAAQIATAQANVNEAVAKAANAKTVLETALAKVTSAITGSNALKLANDQVKTAAAALVAKDALAAAKAKVDAAAAEVSTKESTNDVYTFVASGVNTTTFAVTPGSIQFESTTQTPAADIATYNATTKEFVFVATATAAQKAALAPVIAAAKAEIAAANSYSTAELVAKAAKDTAAKATDLDFTTPAITGVADLDDAVTELTKASDLLTKVTAAQKDLAAKLATVNESAAIVAKIDALQKDVDAAKKAFTDGGYEVPVEAKGALFASDKADVYLVVADSNGAFISGLDKADSVFVGADYTLGADVSKGNDAQLEVFFKTNGLNTDLYVEQKAFGSSSAATDKDIVKITLTGVTADKLVLKDGFITLS